MNNKRVLSIQSHVVYGYVGNKASTLPLQVLGFEVDAINSVQFSNHTAYKCIKGQVLKCEELRELFEGLQSNSLDNYSHLLTGYCGSESFLLEISNVFEKLKKTNPNIVFVCDPVMGDAGKYYVPPSLLPIYRDKLLPMADIITPNQFETELLTGIEIHNEENAYRAMRLLHDKGPRIVVMSSLEYADKNNLLYLLASSKDFKENEFLRMTIPKLDARFTGTGDLFTCMLLAWLHNTNNDLKLSCEKTVSAMQSVLLKTLSDANKSAGSETPTPAHMELRLVQSIDVIRCPSNTIQAEIITTES